MHDDEPRSDSMANAVHAAFTVVGIGSRGDRRELTVVLSSATENTPRSKARTHRSAQSMIHCEDSFARTRGMMFRMFLQHACTTHAGFR